MALELWRSANAYGALADWASSTTTTTTSSTSVRMGSSVICHVDAAVEKPALLLVNIGLGVYVEQLSLAECASLGEREAARLCELAAAHEQTAAQLFANQRAVELSQKPK